METRAESIRRELADLVDNTSDLIQVVTLDGRFLFVNRAWREATGYELDDLPSLRLNDVLWESAISSTLHLLNRIAEGEKIADFETAFRGKTGKKIYLSGSVTCRNDDEGKPTAFRCILHDSTSRVRAERAQNLYYSIANWGVNSQSIDEFYKRIHEELSKVIDAKNFFIALYDSTKHVVHFPYYVDEYFAKNMRFTKRKLGNGITEYALFANKPLFLFEKDILELSEKQGLNLYGQVPKVLLCVPLRVGDRVTGIIGVRSYSDNHQYRPRTLEMLEFISGQVAQAIARKQNEDDLSRQAARLEAIFEGSSYLIWSLNKAFQIMSFNRNYKSLIETQLDVSPAPLVSTERLGWKLMDEKTRTQLNSRYRWAFQGEPQLFEAKLNLKEGPRWYEFSLNPIPLADGSIEEVSGLARDITSRKESQMALQASEEKFRGIFENLQDIYCRTNRLGVITMISPSVLKRTGHTMEEVLGTNIADYFVDKQQIHRALIRLRNEKSLRNFEADLRVKDGSIRQFMFNMLLFKGDNNEPIVAALARDITELKRNERELVKAKDEAERSLKVKERFLANMSHEIRTPMNGVIGMIDLLNETPLNPEQKDYVLTIRRSSETLLTILNDILDLSKIEAGKMALHEAPFEVKEMFDKLTSLFGQIAKNKNNTLVCTIADDLPQYIIADQTRLLQILSNLTSNAIKFTENGSVTITVSTVWRKGKFHKIKVEVRDTGIGISEENLNLLFNAFSQVDNSSKKNFGGTGLGLIISKEMTRLMKGEIGVESTDGKGSMFWFTFETKETVIAPIQKSSLNSDETPEAFVRRRKPSILLVDDNAVNRKVAIEILKKAGCEVEQADSGHKAIAVVEAVFAQNRGFDIIFMDIQMPEMDGIETTQSLRHKFGKKLPPIVAMTAYSMKEDREKFLSQGMDDYLSKPIRQHTLIEKVKDILEKTQGITTPTIGVQTTDNELPIVDVSILSQLLELGGMEIIYDIFEEFVNESTSLVDEANKAFANGDITPVKSNMHTIKGSAGTLGIMRVAEIARIGEQKLKTNDTSTLEADLRILNEKFDEFLKTYKELLETFATETR